MIKVKYSNNTIKEYKTFEKISDDEIVISIDCSYNKLTQLPENMNFPNLQKLDCSGNQLTRLPKNMNLPNLQELYCYGNKLTQLPENMNLPNLQKLYCWNNKLTKLPENMNFPNLQKLYCYNNELIQLSENMNFPNLQELHCWNNKLTQLSKNMNLPILQKLYCYNNKLTQLPKNMNLPNLQDLNCWNNKLTQLPENMNLPNLQILHCANNKLTRLPMCILNFIHLQKISYVNNEIELSPQIAQFIRGIQNRNLNNLNVYNDTQNIHNANIQVSVKDSINNITTRTDLPKFNQDDLIDYILKDDALLNKEQLIEYSNDVNVHSLLLLTFAKVLWYTLQTIIKDFDCDIQQEIKSILNQEMNDAECKCFTGRINRVINCLNGFSPLVSIQISENEQICNIIVIIKEKLELTNSYTIETHKEHVIDDLKERGYSKDIIDTWICFIE